MIAPAPIRVLIVDDDREDYLIAAELLRDVHGTEYAIQWASDTVAAERELTVGAFQVCLLDYRIGIHTGIEFLQAMQSKMPALPPFIMLTGSGDRAIDLEAMQHGASDFLEKGNLSSSLLERSIRYSIDRAAVLADLARKNEELALLNEQKNSFVGMAAHDLRSPLGIIGLSCEMLMDEEGGALTGDQGTLIRRIHSLSDFMRRLVDDMLDLAQIEAGKVALHLEDAELSALVAANLTLSALAADRKKIKIALLTDVQVYLRLDRVKIDQVLTNLIANAVAFSSPGTQVDVGIRKLETEVELTVRDRGPGIPADEVEMLFKPFQSTSVKSTAGERSTGLGLAIARRIVAGHQGRIWVESVEGQGSTFYVVLPLAPLTLQA